MLADGDFITERELGGQHAGPDPATPARGGAGPRGAPSAWRTAIDDLLVDGRARSHPARAGARRRQQEGGGKDARPEPPRALPPARAAGSVGNHHPPPDGMVLVEA